MQIQCEKKGNYYLVKTGSNFNVKNLADIRKVVEKTLDVKPPFVVFDMSECELLDSSGIGLIVNLQKRCSALGGRVGLLDPPDDIRDIVTISGIEQLITIYDNEEEIV
jgi:anti-anti-sigma factor